NHTQGEQVVNAASPRFLKNCRFAFSHRLRYTSHFASHCGRTSCAFECVMTCPVGGRQTRLLGPTGPVRSVPASPTKPTAIAIAPTTELRLRQVEFRALHRLERRLLLLGQVREDPLVGLRAGRFHLFAHRTE